MAAPQFPQCLNCRLLDQADRCIHHNLIILDPAESVCGDFQSEAVVAAFQSQFDPDSLYMWIENPVTQQLEFAALASFDFVRSWSIDVQRAMRVKRTQLRRFFKRAQL
jgi:hypothetical protein